MRHTLARIQEIDEELAALPPIDARERQLTTPQAIGKLIRRVTHLQRHGYTAEQIAGLLRQRGIEVKPQTLERYLRRARASATPEPAGAAPPAPGGTAASAKSRSSAPARVGAGAGASRATRLPDTRPSVETPRPSGRFEVREDTEDI